MYLNIVIALCVYLVPIGLRSQNQNITSVLLDIEQNNQELHAYASLMESRKRESKSINNLPDPQAYSYYLPWGDHFTGAYSEYQVTQAFEFPTVYGVRNKLIKKLHEQLEFEYALKRQNILLPAKKYCLELIYLNKKLEVEQSRVQKAKEVFNQIEKLYELEQVGILEINKAKIAWMQEQFKIDQIETNMLNLLVLLQNLNGGKEVVFNQFDFIDNLKITDIDSLWKDKQLLDPYLIKLQKEEEVAIYQIKLSKNNSLPNFTAGYNYQGISGLNYSGVYGGMSIPLWHNKNKVKAAKAKYQFKQDFTNSQFLKAYADIQKQYNSYTTLFGKYQEYRSTLDGLNSDALLFKSYELGELSFMEYYLEMQFYRRAYDSMLEMENQLNQLKAELLKHQL